MAWSQDVALFAEKTMHADSRGFPGLCASAHNAAKTLTGGHKTCQSPWPKPNVDDGFRLSSGLACPNHPSKHYPNIHVHLLIAMKFTTFLTAVLALFLLAGCKDSGSSSATSATASGSSVLSMEAIAAGASGFTVGSPMSTRTVYVFFDAQCSHCGALWYAAKPLKSQAKFVWIPVGILNAASTSQGATILAAADPSAAMDQHETSLMAKGGGISASGNADAQKDAIKKNTELMNRFGFASIPTIVGKHAQTGEMVKQEGAMPTAALASLLGLQVPAAQ